MMAFSGVRSSWLILARKRDQAGVQRGHQSGRAHPAHAQDAPAVGVVGGDEHRFGGALGGGPDQGGIDLARSSALTNSPRFRVRQATGLQPHRGLAERLKDAAAGIDAQQQLRLMIERLTQPKLGLLRPDAIAQHLALQRHQPSGEPQAGGAQRQQAEPGRQTVRGLGQRQQGRAHGRDSDGGHAGDRAQRQQFRPSERRAGRERGEAPGGQRARRTPRQQGGVGPASAQAMIATPAPVSPPTSARKAPMTLAAPMAPSAASSAVGTSGLVKATTPAAAATTRAQARCQLTANRRPAAAGPRLRGRLLELISVEPCSPLDRT